MPKRNYVDFKAVKQAVSILQILDHYGLTGGLKRNGDSLSGTCPIHKGENPSEFRVSISKNCWNCFSQCKRGGNILDFVRLKENITLRDAALRIAEWFALSMTDGAKQKSGANAEVETLKKRAPVPAKETVAADESAEPNKPLGFQLQNLDQTHPYLTERGLTIETIVDFGLGFCAKGSMAGRIVIPIHNPEGQVVAYAGRWPGTPPADTPKYKLPPGFRKSLELFNIDQALKEPDDVPLVIVEGFFDCIKLVQHGVRRVVALMGSGMSQGQESLLCKYINSGDRVALMLDEDDAGREGREQILQRLATKMYVKIIRFDQEGDQPGDLTEDELFRLLSEGRGV